MILGCQAYWGTMLSFEDTVGGRNVASDKNSQEFLRNLRNSEEFLGILQNSEELMRIQKNSW